MDERSSLGPGKRLAEFEIERPLGQGGFGVTYLATDTQTGRRVVARSAPSEESDERPVTHTEPVSEASAHPVSSELAAAVDAALAVDPEARPQSLGEWRVMLGL